LEEGPSENSKIAHFTFCNFHFAFFVEYGRNYDLLRNDFLKYKRFQ
jgi:hypothetical protein